MRKGLTYFLIGLILPFFLVLGGVSAAKENVIVFAGNSITSPTADLASEFQKVNPDYNITWNLASTPELIAEVVKGTTPDLFIATSSFYTKRMKNSRYFVNDSVKNLTSNWMMVIIPAKNPANITTLADLAKPGVKIAMGIKETPVGINARKVLGLMENSFEYGTDWKDAVINNTVAYGISEPAVVEKVKNGEVDAGFAYVTSFTNSKEDLKSIEIPAVVNVIQLYGIGVMKGARNPKGAAAFEEFLLSNAGQKILNDHGYAQVS
jgi:molybdate transport system substrate-binding protein